MQLTDRLQHAWNAFKSRDPTNGYGYGHSNTTRPDRMRMHYTNERTIIGSIYNRIGIDVAAVSMKHVRIDQNGRYKDTIDSGLNYCLTTQANIDQTGRALVQDIVMSMCDEGSVAIVPVETSINPAESTGFNITNIRIGEILEWFPKHIRVRLYNEKIGIKEDILIAKSSCAIVENPLYAVMNEPNSTLKRLTHKLNLLDSIDEQNGSGKLDLILQLPYVVKSEARKQQAKERAKDIEMQLTGSKYGIAYTDGTEKITQLNRPVENNLLAQIDNLTSMLYSQLGLTDAVMNGTADDAEMLNYYNRTIEPFLSAITDAMNCKFLTKTARTQGQKVMFFREPFKLVPVNQLAEIVDKFSRNEILSSNEIRALMGYRPVEDPAADELRNANLNRSKDDSSIRVDSERIEGEKNNEEQ